MCIYDKQLQKLTEYTSNKEFNMDPKINPIQIYDNLSNSDYSEMCSRYTSIDSCAAKDLPKESKVIKDNLN